ncbi:glycosyltransferase family 2 protein [Alloiococcus sp. CFN-8]|uniref:glycosyltransferase family 2 protein n=1 Tax=Alloiococcus sp. CFN-8 TaxID=3416081 RepID=UPI003CEE536A
MKNIISVIVPIYNVQLYLPQCLDSILQQTYRNLEVILIDDGSTDQSGIICDTYSKKDNRITVIHQHNGGAASAKNTGLSVATGEYLAFVDSDDFLELDAYEYMIDQLKSKGADIIQCSFSKVYLDGVENQIKLNQLCEFDTEAYLSRYTIDWTCGLLWDKLYRRDLFKNVFFEEGHKIDDEFFTYQGVMNAKKIIHSPHIVYNYRQRKSSVMTSVDSKNQIVLDKLNYLNQRRKKVSVKFPALKEKFDYHFLDMLLILSQDTSASYESLSVTKRLLKEYFHEGESCRMKLGMRYQLFLLQYGSINKRLRKKQEISSTNNLKRYYE